MRMEMNGICRHDYGMRHHGSHVGRRARTDNV